MSILKISRASRHRGGYILVIISTFVLFLLTALAHTLAVYDKGQYGIFIQSTDDIWMDYYRLDITPSKWVFSLFGVIYVAQAIWLIYGLSTLCRLSGTEDACLYCDPGHMPIVVYVLYMVGLGAQIAWLFVWDRLLVQYSFVPIFIGAVAMNTALGFSLHELERATPKLIVKNLKHEIYLVGILVQNGMGLFSEFLNLLALMNIAIVLTYFGNIDSVSSGSIALGIYSFLACLWFILDIFVIKNKTKFLILPYLVPVIVLIGIIDKNAESQGQNFLFALILMCVIILMVVVKIVMMIRLVIKGSQKNTVLSTSLENENPPMSVVQTQIEQKSVLNHIRQFGVNNLSDRAINHVHLNSTQKQQRTSPSVEQRYVWEGANKTQIVKKTTNWTKIDSSLPQNKELLRDRSDESQVVKEAFPDQSVSVYSRSTIVTPESGPSVVYKPTVKPTDVIYVLQRPKPPKVTYQIVSKQKPESDLYTPEYKPELVDEPNIVPEKVQLYYSSAQADTTNQIQVGAGSYRSSAMVEGNFDDHQNTTYGSDQGRKPANVVGKTYFLADQYVQKHDKFGNLGTFEKAINIPGFEDRDDYNSTALNNNGFIVDDAWE